MKTALAAALCLGLGCGPARAAFNGEVDFDSRVSVPPFVSQFKEQTALKEDRKNSPLDPGGEHAALKCLAAAAPFLEAKNRGYDEGYYLDQAMRLCRGSSSAEAAIGCVSAAEPILKEKDRGHDKAYYLEETIQLCGGACSAQAVIGCFAAAEPIFKNRGRGKADWIRPAMRLCRGASSAAEPIACFATTEALIQAQYPRCNEACRLDWAMRLCGSSSRD